MYNRRTPYCIWNCKYRYLFNDETKTNLLDGPSKADTNTIVPYTKLSGNASSTDFTYSTWIYVNNWNTKHGKDKIILQRKSNDGNFSPQIKLDPYKNDLTINTSYSGGAGGPNGTSQSSNQTCKINTRNMGRAAGRAPKHPNPP